MLFIVATGLVSCKEQQGNGTEGEGGGFEAGHEVSGGSPNDTTVPADSTTNNATQTDPSAN